MPSLVTKAVELPLPLQALASLPAELVAPPSIHGLVLAKVPSGCGQVDQAAEGVICAAKIKTGWKLTQRDENTSDLNRILQ